MSKAIITYRDAPFQIAKQEIQDFPLLFGQRGILLNKEDQDTEYLYLDKITHIDVAPEEEYFIMNDSNGQYYAIPDSKQEDWNNAFGKYLIEQRKSDHYLKARYYLEDFHDYKFNDNWNDFKITKK